MDLAVRGWSRDCGSRELTTAKLTKARFTDQLYPTVGSSETVVSVGDLALDKSASGQITIMRKITTAGKPLNGDYLLSLSLTRGELVTLLKNALGAMTVSELLGS